MDSGLDAEYVRDQVAKSRSLEPFLGPKPSLVNTAHSRKADSLDATTQLKKLAPGWHQYQICQWSCCWTIFCQSFHTCNDETFWKLKCKEDFNFSSSRTARTSGWKYIYQGLSNPKVYVWGSKLPIAEAIHTEGWVFRRFLAASMGGIPYPMRLRFPKKTAIVELIAGGWSFHALDSQGRVFVWGTLDGERSYLTSNGFSVQRISETPLQLQLPTQIRALSCGRKHSMALDSSGQIWTFISWGRPFRLVTPLLDNSSPDETPVQTECGWSYSAALTASGNVLVWWPFGQSMQHVYNTTMTQMNESGDEQAHATVDGMIPCSTWDMQQDPHRLPPLPSLSELSDSRHTCNESERQETKLVKIAAMDNFLIGLTNKGHVLKFGDLSNETSLQQGRWEYLPFFSEIERVRAHPTFAGGERTENKNQETLQPPANFKIAHITAHFEHFVAYTTEVNSVVLRGSTDTTADHEAEIIPALQYKSIISVVLGDYHNAALTAEGKLYTWGVFSTGALGLGIPEELPAGTPGGYATQEQLERARQGRRIQVREVEVPTEVRFDHGKKKGKGKWTDRFCFSATAAGWHTGALVIDLEPKGKEDEGYEENEFEEESDSDPTSQMPGRFDPVSPLAPPGPRVVPLHRVPRGHAPPFRVGFAGRGRNLGPRGRGGNDGI
ncbi:hypothetical protein EW145_g4827 [Phellinidium pouzarii]|uniref:Uncharacterized protein n=1 Tax=Phellinidium pouzarii TaxID=167371 RepID=A0A4S4L2C2_9AGAM|nr:hypothetical protein EW145_g4827 [Phellinidium pouzarii]